MKRLLLSKISLSIICLSTFCSCKKQLKEYNPSGVTAEAAYTTATGYETLVSGAYSFTRYWYGKEEGFGLGEFGTDLWTAGSESFIATSGVAGANKPLITYNGIYSTNENITRLWRRLYSALNLCNQGIKISEGSDFKPSPEKVAEVRFLRAFYLWHITETWGEAHLATEPTTEPTLTAKKASKAEFYSVIISDLDKAIAGLPATSNYGRVNSWTAKAFKARVLLTSGDYAGAKALAEDVITNSGKSLVSNFSDLWDKESQNNSENMWSANFAADINTSDVYDKDRNPYGYGDDIFSSNGNPTNNRGNNNGHMLFVCGYDRVIAKFDNMRPFPLRNMRYGWPFIRVAPTKYLLDLYDGSKDARYKSSFQTVWILNQNPTPNKVNRLTGKVLFKDTAFVIDKNPVDNPNYYSMNVYDMYDPTTGASKNMATNTWFPVLKKHLDIYRTATLPTSAGGGTTSDPDVPVASQAAQGVKDVYLIRFAEMYLISAEASIRLGETGNALLRINELRAKRALPGVNMDVTAGDMTLDFILDERGREFAGEYLRWFDVKRIKNDPAQWVDWLSTKNPDLKGAIQPYHIVRPIPQKQLDAVSNKSEFTQNFGY